LQIVRVANHKDIRSIEETLIVLTLSETDGEKAISKVFEPKMGHDRQATQTLDKLEASLWAL
jgi:hypothetical protein